LGNQDVNITALDTSGAIETNWDAAQTSPRIPALVMVSACNMAATGTSRPYEDLHYAWNFGDASGTETFTRPTDGATVNANSDQVGPEAAYCYRTAGSYTITLTIAGAGGNVVAQKTKSITVGAFTPSVTYWCDSNATGANTGVDAANAFTSLASVNSAINHATTTTTSNVLIKLARGSTFTTGLGFNILSTQNDNYSGIRIQPYGSGAKPIINPSNAINAGANHGKNGIKIYNLASVARTFDDFVCEGVDFRQSNDTISCVSITTDTNPFDDNTVALGRTENVYFLDCPMNISADVNQRNPVVGYDGHITFSPNKRGGFWNCQISNPDTATFGSSGISGSPTEWFFMVGCSISGWGENNFDHHIYPECRTHELYKWSRFGKAGVSSNRGVGINCNYEYNAGYSGTPGAVINAPYHLVSECEMMGTDVSVDCGNRVNNGLSTDCFTLFQSFVVERCSMHDLNANTYVMQLPCAQTFTLRDNRAFKNDACALLGPPVDSFYTNPSKNPTYFASNQMRGNIYRNRVLMLPASTNNGGFITINDTTNYTNAQQWTRNIVKDARSSTFGPCIGIKPSTQSTPGSVINRNQFYSVNNSAAICYDFTTGTSYNYAAWQATGFDANGTNTDPGWSSSATQWSDLN
jgi:hypothetical protein